jgi:hypothetical protein
MVNLAWLVDVLPSRLWKPGNLYMPFGHRLHFCSGTGAAHSVRTIEWDGREIARGKQQFGRPPEEPTWLWRVVVPRVVDGLPARLWAPPRREWLGGRVVFEVEEADGTDGAVRVIDLFGRPGFFRGENRLGPW